MVVAQKGTAALCVGGKSTCGDKNENASGQARGMEGEELGCISGGEWF